jgi:hypothetical protein
MSARTSGALLTAAVLLAAATAACSAAGGTAAPGTTASPGAGVPAQGSTPSAPASAPAGRPSDLPIGTPRFPPLGPTAAPITGEAPAAIVAAARRDLATKVGVDAAASAEVVVSEAVTWPDGSLGCPVPGQLYPQVVTPGYHVVFRVGTTTYDYRATEAGVVSLCEHRAPGG